MFIFSTHYSKYKMCLKWFWIFNIFGGGFHRNRISPEIRYKINLLTKWQHRRSFCDVLSAPKNSKPKNIESCSREPSASDKATWHAPHGQPLIDLSPSWSIWILWKKVSWREYRLFWFEISMCWSDFCLHWYMLGLRNDGKWIRG